MLQVKAPKGSNLCYFYLIAFVPVDETVFELWLN